jgi:hypothetical protein
VEGRKEGNGERGRKGMAKGKDRSEGRELKMAKGNDTNEGKEHAVKRNDPPW